MAKTRRTKVTKVRFWRWRRSPLRRRSDRLEAWIVLCTWTLALLGGVSAGWMASESVADGIASRRAEVHPVAAVLTEDAAKTLALTASGSSSGTVWAKVRWTAPDGSARTGPAKVEPGSKTGTAVTVWTDRTGKLVSEPATATETKLEAAFAGVLIGTSAGGGVLLCGWLVRELLARRRLADWDAEWKRIGPQWRKRMIG
ncbi:Rv1733c family protein [Streptomyces sp. NPDC002814]